jgi:putative sporulation protein YtxC
VIEANMSRDIHLNIISKYSSFDITSIPMDNIFNRLEYDDELKITINLDDNNIIKSKEDSSKAITSVILNLVKYKLLNDYISEIYNYIDEKDSEHIKKIAVIKFREIENDIEESIMCKVIEHLDSNMQLNLKGFLNFRLKDVLERIYMIAEISAEEYLISKDQDEFTEVLKHFIALHESKIDYLKVYINPDYTFDLYDKEGNIVKGIEDEEITNIMLKENMNYEDFFISTLLSLCPKVIEILDLTNTKSSKELITMIKSIFQDKVKEVYKN